MKAIALELGVAWAASSPVRASLGRAGIARRAELLKRLREAEVEQRAIGVGLPSLDSDVIEDVQV
jgi:hypothetical protein